jgi:hypothetical protein
MEMKVFNEGKSKYTMNLVIILLAISQGIMLIFVGSMDNMNYFEQVISFFTTGIPNPPVCGPLFLIWAIVCILYWTKKVSSPKLATIVAVVLVYFGTVNVITFTPYGLNWPNFIHMLQAYIGYGYFIDSFVFKYKIWRR